MNQSTTQLGSKRQSQGKHLYPAISISICCCVVIFCILVFYCFFVFSFCDYCAGLLFFFIVYFHKDGSPACSHLVLKSLLCSSLLYVLIARGHTAHCQCIFMSMDLLSHLQSKLLTSFKCLTSPLLSL